MGYIPKLIKTTDLAADLITGAKLADDAIDSEHYATGSIDTAHIANDQITLALMAGGTDGNIISYDASGDPVAIATGDDGEVLTSAGAGAPPAFEAVSAGGGLERVSIFRLTTSFTGAAGSGITSNWEESDTYGYGKGDAAAAVTESSGIFTFAATGVYLVYFHVEAYGTDDHGTTYGNIRVTTDSGSNYYDSAYGNASINVVGGANTHQGTNAFQIVDVTSTSVVKCLFTAATHASNTIYGTTNQNTTYCMFLQLNST